MSDPTFKEKQAKFCLDDRGYTSSHTLLVTCKCKCFEGGRAKCPGHLVYGYRAANDSAAFLVCTICGCDYKVLA